MSRLTPLPLPAWPAAERTAWTIATTPADTVLDDEGAALRLRPHTRRLYQRVAGIWLALLQEHNAPLSGETPASRATSDRLNQWIAGMRARGLKPSTIGLYMMSLHGFFRIVDPASDTRHILRPGDRSLIEIFPCETKPFPMHDTADLLAAVERMHQVGMASSREESGRLLLRDAAMLGILLTFGPRVSNLSQIRIGTELAEITPGHWRLHFAAEQTKSHRTLSFDLDARCNRWLKDYLAVARPSFNASSASLWLRPDGRALTVDNISRVFRRFTRNELGESHGPHTARKWLRSTAARRSPNLAFDAAQVLGHTVEVSIRHYTEAGSLHSQRRHGQRLAQARKELAALLRSADQA